MIWKRTPSSSSTADRRIPKQKPTMRSKICVLLRWDCVLDQIIAVMKNPNNTGFHHEPLRLSFELLSSWTEQTSESFSQGGDQEPEGCSDWTAEDLYGDWRIRTVGKTIDQAFIIVWHKEKKPQNTPQSKDSEGHTVHSEKPRKLWWLDQVYLHGEGPWCRDV